MLATTLIYLSGLALSCAAGVAITALVEPRGRWLTPAAPAAGAAFLVVAAHLAGYLLSGTTAGAVVGVASVAALAFAVWRRRRTSEPLRGAFALGRGEALSLALGAALGLALLVPVLSIGFPTTFSAGIADGWARAVLSEWLLDHPLVDSGQALGVARPAGRYSSFPQELGAGYEYLVAIVSSVTGRRTYETALPVAALAAPIALAGWTRLHAAITERRPEVWQVLVLAVATASPAFLLPFTQTFLTQFMSLALWPFAMGTTYAFLRRPGVGAVAAAAIALAALAGVYPPLAPWLVLPAVVLVVACARHAPVAWARRLPARARRLAPVLAAFLALAIALVVLAPVELVRAYRALVLFSGLLSSNANFPLFQSEQDLALVLGATSEFTLLPVPQSTALLLPVLGLVAVAAAIGIAATVTMARTERRAVVALGGGVGAVTLALYLKYKYSDEYGYGTYKALISGGALLTGLLMLALASPSAHWRGYRLAAAALCLAVWIPIAAGMLDRQYHGPTGFRQAENGLIHALAEQPRDSVVLTEGASDNASAFQMRMTMGYVAMAFDRPVDGLGSTSSYMTLGGSPLQRPSRPWSYVVTSDKPSLFKAHRRTVWQRPPYLIQEATPVDVTPYALTPNPRIGTGSQRFWVTSPPGAPPTEYGTGPVELIVANRQPRPTRARLKLALRGEKPRRTVTIGAGPGQERRVRLRKGATRTVTVRPLVPANGITRVTLDPGTPSLGAIGNLTPLFAITGLGIR